jgi:hypothetical protein
VRKGRGCVRNWPKPDEQAADRGAGMEAGPTITGKAQEPQPTKRLIVEASSGNVFNLLARSNLPIQASAEHYIGGASAGVKAYSPITDGVASKLGSNRFTRLNRHRGQPRWPNRELVCSKSECDRS